MFELRPNLCNPACKDEFDALKEKESKRLETHYNVNLNLSTYSIFIVNKRY